MNQSDPNLVEEPSRSYKAVYGPDMTDEDMEKLEEWHSQIRSEKLNSFFPLGGGWIDVCKPESLNSESLSR